MELDDKALITRVLDNRDQRAFAELVKRYQSQIRYSQRQLTGWDEALADDLAQETFLSVYRNLSKFRGDAKFSTWLYRIAYNCFRQHKRASRIEEPLGDDDVTPDTGTTDSDIDMHRDLARAADTATRAANGDTLVLPLRDESQRDRRSTGQTAGLGEERYPTWP